MEGTQAKDAKMIMASTMIHRHAMENLQWIWHLEIRRLLGISSSTGVGGVACERLLDMDPFPKGALEVFVLMTTSRLLTSAAQCRHKYLMPWNLAITCSLAIAFEPSPLQDFCVADTGSSARVNGLACKDPKLAQADDFFFSGLHVTGNTSNPVGSKVTPVTAAQIPGLNTLGISMVRLDYAPWGINPPHTHPRATEILTILEGSLHVGFVTSNPDNRLITKVLQKGDVFVFPVGLVHFQRNVGYGNAVAIAALSSQNPGVITIANAIFGSNPPIATEVLTKAFQVDKSVVDWVQSKF
ncbi:hypothetical protein HHK36_004805 [Tetracentron sinense]|uniref:Germin-like protein n=1 Tax=Tetracentron sinense TaxID=13715 RepID=A0A835DQI6_TETSI|nr:hypothetical protein HHK36_004805 [Tetracentron sinense]